MLHVHSKLRKVFSMRAFFCFFQVSAVWQRIKNSYSRMRTAMAFDSAGTFGRRVDWRQHVWSFHWVACTLLSRTGLICLRSCTIPLLARVQTAVLSWIHFGEDVIILFCVIFNATVWYVRIIVVQTDASVVVDAWQQCSSYSWPCLSEKLFVICSWRL